MAARGSFPIKVDSNFRGFAIVLKSAACEWLLLFLLLLDAAFSFLLTKFAQYCELQLPCILCSRLDHVLGNEKPGFYRNMLCNDHKSEMSSLVLCQKHGKLADAHEMCEECLMSYAKKGSNQETYKILVGKLGSDCLQKPFLCMDSGISTRLCSCCTKPWRSRPNLNKMVQSRPSGSARKPDIPLPKSPGRRFLHCQEGSKKRKDRFSVTPAALLFGNPDCDSLSAVGYSDVKINSDSESDFPFSDDEDMFPFSCGVRRVKDEFLSQMGSKLSPRTQYDEVSQAGLIHKPAHYMSNRMHMDTLSEKPEAVAPKFTASNGDISHSFAEANWQQIRQKASPALSEFTSLDDVSLSSSSSVSSPVASAEQDDRASGLKKFGGPGFPDPVFHNNALLSRNVQMPSRLSRESRTKENGDIEHTPAMTNWQSIDLDGTTTTVKGTETDLIKKDAVSIPNDGTNDSGEHLPSITKDVILSEKHSSKDCNGIGSIEETNIPRASSPLADALLVNKNLMANGHVDGHHMVINRLNTIDSSVRSKSPSVNTLNTIGSSMCSKSPSILSHESLEAFAELEGESLIDKLRRQVEYYKKSMHRLFKELEEERNASAISANQAMAMITKLQEEKAALHMEARQYLRMMDEQAEYDVDALEKANDLLAEKEKEIQDLEAELDYFRIKYPDDFAEYSHVQDAIVDMEGALISNMEDIDIEES